MRFRYSRNSFETLRSDSLFIVGYQGFRRTVTIWSRVSSENLIVAQTATKLSAFHRARRFITVITRTHHWSLYRETLIQSIHSHPISFKFIKWKNIQTVKQYGHIIDHKNFLLLLQRLPFSPWSTQTSFITTKHFIRQCVFVWYVCMYVCIFLSKTEVEEKSAVRT
jgi:hypothetical protein